MDGVFQEYVSHEAKLCFKLPENVSTLEGALIEPLAVGFHAGMQGQAKVGQTAAVMGGRLYRPSFHDGAKDNGIERCFYGRYHAETLG